MYGPAKAVKQTAVKLEEKTAVVAISNCSVFSASSIVYLQLILLAQPAPLVVVHMYGPCYLLPDSITSIPPSSLQLKNNTNLLSPPSSLEYSSLCGPSGWPNCLYSNNLTFVFPSHYIDSAISVLSNFFLAQPAPEYFGLHAWTLQKQTKLFCFYVFLPFCANFLDPSSLIPRFPLPLSLPFTQNPLN